LTAQSRILFQQEDQAVLAVLDRGPVFQLRDRAGGAHRYISIAPGEHADVELACGDVAQALVNRPLRLGDIGLHGDVVLPEALQRQPDTLAALPEVLVGR
jgi:hypothetical protein